MFFSSNLIIALKKDHDGIREENNILKNPDESFANRNEAFHRLIRLFVDHTRREEMVVYNHMRTIMELKSLAEEGEVEHRMGDSLIARIQTENSVEAWSAHAMVLARLIENHLDTEEMEVFPELKRFLDADEDNRLRRLYESTKSEMKLARAL